MDNQVLPPKQVSESPAPTAGKPRDWFKILQIVIGFLIALGLFGNIYLLTRKQKAQTPIGYPAPLELKTYLNERYSYSIQYPFYLSFREDTSDIFLLRTTFSMPQDGYAKGFSIQVEEAGDFKKIVENGLAKIVGHVAEKTSDIQKTSIAGHSAERYDFELFTGNNKESWSIIYFTNGKHIFSIDGSVGLLDQILSTFRFD